MINRVILVGNLTRDTEAVAGARTPFARLRLATNSQWRDADGNRQEAVEYHSVVAFGRTAEICAEYGVRGRRVYIEGRLRSRDYDGSDGLRRHTTEIVVDSLRWLDRRDPATPVTSSTDSERSDADQDESDEEDTDPEQKRRLAATATAAAR